MQRWTRVQQKLGTHARHPASTSVQQTPRAYPLAQGAAAQPYSSAGGGPLNARHAALTPRTGRYPTIECLEQESRRLETQIRSLQQEAKALSVSSPVRPAQAHRLALAKFGCLEQQYGAADLLAACTSSHHELPRLQGFTLLILDNAFLCTFDLARVVGEWWVVGASHPPPNT